MKTPPLSSELTTAVLNHLNLAPATPEHAFLDALLDAYVRTVPWESVFRIVRWGKTAVWYGRKFWFFSPTGEHGVSLVRDLWNRNGSLLPRKNLCEFGRVVKNGR